MLQKSNQQKTVLIVAFFSYLISNVTVFFGTIWLIPGFVIAEALLLGTVAAISLLILIKSGSLSIFLATIKNNWFILPFLLFSGLSFFWSISPNISLVRWLVLISILIISGLIGSLLSIRELLKSLCIFGIFILIVCTVLVILVPNIGVMNYYIIKEAWKGIFWHKNHMGLFASFVNILILLQLLDAIFRKNKYCFLHGLFYLFSLFIIIKTDSVAAYITTASLHGMVFLALVWFKIRRKIRWHHYVLVLVALILVSLIVFLKIDNILSLFDRNVSLTGRIPMWTYLFDTYLKQRPFFGYGFNAFWYSDGHRVAIQQAAGYPDQIVVADNGFIDILMNLGMVGLLSFLGFYLGVWWRSIKFTGKTNGVYALFPLLFMVFTLVANITWSLIFENESFFMLILLSILFWITKDQVHPANTATRNESLIS